jgi:hypothetical protein
MYTEHRSVAGSGYAAILVCLPTVGGFDLGMVGPTGALTILASHFKWLTIGTAVAL